MAVKLIATDIDGTLLDSRHQISEKNLAALDDAAARGIEIVLVTGRRFDFARQIADQLRCDWHLISSNGAVIKSPDGKTHQRDLLDAKLARRVLDATREFRSGAAVVFDRERARQVVVEKIDLGDPFRGSYFRRNIEFVTAVDPLTDCFDGDDPIQVGYVGRCSHMRQIKEVLENLPFAGEYTLAITEYEFRDLSILDVLKRGVTKGNALAAWTRHRGFTPDEVMAVGDNWNDREMLEFAGIPVVMGNAVAELKSLGWPITGSNDESGLGDAIRTYALEGTVIK